MRAHPMRRCPFCFKEAGVGLAALLVLTSLIASSFGMRLLLLGAHLKGVRTYDDLILNTLGRTGSQVREQHQQLRVGVILQYCTS